jgi:hypothetical protein
MGDVCRRRDLTTSSEHLPSRSAFPVGIEISHIAWSNSVRCLFVRGEMSSHSISIEPDEVDDLPPYNPSSSTATPHAPSATPQPDLYGRITNIAGEIATDRRYTGGDTLDEPVSTTIVPTRSYTKESNYPSSYVMLVP